MVAIVATLYAGMSNQGVPKSTMNRDKLTVNASYQTNCVWDDMGWIDTASVSRAMKPFYDSTGIQPALAVFDYIPGVTGYDYESEQYAKDWYDDHIEGEGALFLAYFDTGTEEEGWAYLVYGDMTKSVMDAEAEDIFWAYYDRYWMDNSISLDDAYPAMFVKTGERIMQKTTTGLDIVKIMAVGIVIVFVAGSIIIVMTVKRKHDSQKAKETAEILNKPLEHLADSESDRLAEKYNKP